MCLCVFANVFVCFYLFVSMCLCVSVCVYEHDILVIKDNQAGIQLDNEDI